jgi:3-deoxy-D-manno-octulosonic-acid transferase
MLFVYRVLINLIFILSPVIIIFRVFQKKEDLKRFKEKFCFFSKKKKEGQLIWFHGASVGEILSIMPVLNKLEKNPNISQVLVTSNTLSSSKIIEKYKFKKLVHQFFPIDTNFFSNKFLNYWKPSTAFFIDSEIWPNTIDNLKKKNIPIILLNGRITKKTFTKWKLLSNFAKNIFSKFNLCLASSNKSKNYLTILGAKKVKMIGNLKYSQLEDEKNFLSENIKKDLHSKKIWCASSTHESEETFCGLIHKRLKKKYKNLLTIIIPRHIERVDSIQKDLLKLNLKVQTHEPQKKIRSDTDIYIVNSYGKTKSFYNICKNVFLGGSLINHGGQNPLEAARFGCNILHGPNVSNFEEIYKFLKEKKISIKINNQKQMIKSINKLFQQRSNSKFAQKKLKLIGQKILNETYKEIRSYL